MQNIFPVGIWSQYDVVLTSMRRDDVASTLIQRHIGTKCPLGLFYTSYYQHQYDYFTFVMNFFN